MVNFCVVDLRCLFCLAHCVSNPLCKNSKQPSLVSDKLACMHVV